MNQVDALLLVLLVPFVLRGYWRGFCREGFGLAGLIGGALMAAASGNQLAGVLIARGIVPGAAAVPVAWVAIFVGTVVAAALLGRLAERLARVLFLGGVSRVGGALLGCAKGAALLAFALLFVERVAPTVKPVIAASRVGRPLTQLAAGVLGRPRPVTPAPAGEQV